MQTAAGFNDAEQRAAGVATPRPLPCQALDHASGALMAFGILAALHRRADIGGSWHVQVSLAATARWLRGLGRVENGFSVAEPDLAGCCETVPSGFGTLSAARHAAILSQTPARWDRPSVPLGTHAPAWSGSA